jgi:hypothetical protein
MSGLEILGAVSATIDIGLFCHRAIRRLSQSDRELSNAILAECTTLIEEIDKRTLTLLPDSRPATATLRTRLSDIKSKIETRKMRNKWIKGVAILRQFGTSDKESMIAALQTYQTLAVMWGNEAIEKVQLGNNEIKNDVKTAFQHISQVLEVIATSSAHVGTEMKTMRVETNAGIEAIKTLSNDILREIQEIRNESGYPVLSVIKRSSDIDRAQIEIKLDTTTEYIQKVRGAGGYLSDLEVWELVWDFIEIYREYGAVVLDHLEEGSNSPSRKMLNAYFRPTKMETAYTRYASETVASRGYCTHFKMVSKI